jgi:hypothetical protein
MLDITGPIATKFLRNKNSQLKNRFGFGNMQYQIHPRQ